jgi:pimeloyl-ACP methyl ester carboxylesterase
VLVHTLGTDHRMWDPVLDALARERDVIAVDMPGFGASPALSGDGDAAAAPARLATAIAGFLAAELGVERPHVAGNSLGGWVALELALQGAARSVTAIAPAGLWRGGLAPKRYAARRLARTLLPALPLLMAAPAARRAALTATVAHPERIPAAAARRLVRAYAVAPGFEAASNAMRAGAFEGLARIEVPVTLAWPECDRLVARPAALPPQVRNVPLPGAGHMPTWDDPAAVARVLLDGSAG